MSDLYETLGLKRGAGEDEIKRAYRTMAKTYHPDRNRGNAKAEERFKAIGAAYAILSDASKRARYDRGEIDENGQERAPFGGGYGGGPGRGGFGGGQEEDLSAFFSDMFSGGFQGDFHPGGGGGRRAPRRGADRHYRASISFIESVLGTTVPLETQSGEKLDVRVPPGIEEGQTLRLRGRGGQGPRGPAGAGLPGDAMVEISVRPDERFTRDGSTVRTTLGIDLYTAVLGGKVTVPTPKGSVSMTVPRHTDTGRVLRLGGRGVAARGSVPAGDLLVTLEIRLGDVDPRLEAFLAETKG